MVLTKMSNVKDFSCIGGLEKHIRIVKEMVLFPLLYGDVYAKFNLKPPRGLLFYGPPGTGKTLVASALAAECSNSERKVSFISRKGSDCLSKWVGESEKKLEKIFSLAHQTKPCIIFFDEVDGLAPVRSSRQDFVHASVVSTLLALMDGLDNNSEIIVIGATNRIDAIDPALRRPGRFDRELYFPLPCYNARKEILSVHIRSWKQKPTQKFLSYLAAKTVGYCGSDLQALCAEAVMCCVRRNYPQIYTSKSRYHINERHLKVEKQDFLKAQENIVPAAHRVTVAPIKSLPMKVQPLLQDNLSAIMSRLQALCPDEMLTSDTVASRNTTKSTSCPRILLCGNDDSHTRHLGPALLHALEHLPCHVLDVTTLFEETGRAAEESIIQKVKTARRALPSLLYVPDILAWWDLVDETARVVFTSLMRGLDQSVHMLILTTANCLHADLPTEIAALYEEHQGEVFEVQPPGTQERFLFFNQLFCNPISDGVSDRSSQGDLLQALNPKKTKPDAGRKKTAQQNTTTARQLRAQTRARKKLSGVQSSPSTMISMSKFTVKRKHSASGEGPPSKRYKLPGESATSSFEGTSDPQAQDLLQKLVQSTKEWTSGQLESLYAALELALEREDEDPYSTVDKYIVYFEELRKNRLLVKRQKSQSVL